MVINFLISCTIYPNSIAISTAYFDGSSRDMTKCWSCYTVNGSRDNILTHHMTTNCNYSKRIGFVVREKMFYTIEFLCAVSGVFQLNYCFVSFSNCFLAYSYTADIHTWRKYDGVQERLIYIKIDIWNVQIWITKYTLHFSSFPFTIRQ